MAVRIDERTFADAAIAPRDLAGVKLHRCQYRTRKAVKITADENRTAVMVAHVFCEVDLLRSSIGFDFDEATASVVIRRNKHAIAARDRRCNVRNVVRGFAVLPKQTSVFYVETVAAPGRDEDALRAAIPLQGNR